MADETIDFASYDLDTIEKIGYKGLDNTESNDISYFQEIEVNSDATFTVSPIVLY